jgi:DNA-binding IclR family transcriptional regulator
MSATFAFCNARAIAAAPLSANDDATLRGRSGCRVPGEVAIRAVPVGTKRTRRCAARRCCGARLTPVPWAGRKWNRVPQFHVIYSPAQRCLDILEALADAPDGMSLSSLGASLGLPKSAAHRFATLLESRGFVRQDAITRRYRLTLKLPQLAFRFIAATGVTDVGQPVLDALAERTGELARLAIVDGETLTWVARAQGAPKGLRYDDEAGREVVLHATATGKAWLATLPDSEALAIVARAGAIGARSYGPRALSTLAELKRDLRATRRRGWGEAVEEGEPGVVAVAAVVRARAADAAPVVATVSVAGPLARLDAARREAAAQHTLAAARELTALWPARSHLVGRAAAA